jgi:dTDP-glucose pyrophosphorylase
MAAGLGTRFGGLKQLEPVGPRGEAILDYTIRDAVAAGLRRVVLVVRSEIRSAIAEHVEALVAGMAAPPELALVHQDELPPAREKPWGTVHAVLSAAPAVDGPFVLVNADDYYGASVALAAHELRAVDAGTALLVAFELDHTVPREGAVSRGVCAIRDGELARLVETHGLARRSDGTIHADDGPPLDPATPVSMNLWGFDPSIFERLRRRFDAFIAAHGASDRTECLLPDEIGALIEAGELRVRVVRTTATWTGITNRDDLHAVRARLAALHPPSDA